MLTGYNRNTPVRILFRFVSIILEMVLYDVYIVLAYPVGWNLEYIVEAARTLLSVVAGDHVLPNKGFSNSKIL